MLELVCSSSVPSHIDDLGVSQSATYHAISRLGIIPMGKRLGIIPMGKSSLRIALPS